MVVTTGADERLEARVVTRQALPAVTAGSALLRIGSRLLAVHDDAFRVTWIDPATLACESWVLSGDGNALPKAGKPDFEAAVVVGDSAVYLLGSGSTPQRCRVARLDVARRMVALEDRTSLYDTVHRALSLTVRPNIEGAVVVGEQLLLLLHRGVGGAPSACLSCDARALGEGAAVIDAVEWLALGMLDGVPLGCTDLALAANGRRFFVAAAEDTADAVADGAVAGSVLGVMGGGATRFAPIVDASGRLLRAKVEGLVIDPDARGAWLLSDADDRRRPAELCRVELAGPWLD